MVINQVLATRHGYKTLKFFNRKKSKLMLINDDLLEGVGDNENVFVNEESFGAELPLEDANWDYFRPQRKKMISQSSRKLISPNWRIFWKIPTFLLS